MILIKKNWRERGGEGRGERGGEEGKRGWREDGGDDKGNKEGMQAEGEDMFAHLVQVVVQQASDETVQCSLSSVAERRGRVRRLLSVHHFMWTKQSATISTGLEKEPDPRAIK